jgi:SAM-dependent methyltransferase
VSLKALQRQWDRFGRKDPLWAVLSLPDKRHGRWNEAEFFATGEREIGGVLDRARALGVVPDPARALDFGCGVGRLTRALARRFERVDGVDIAPSMIERAERDKPERCHFHLNPHPDLRLFEDGAFTFVYTNLVLQHLPPELARSYVRELLRVLRRGGLLIFHLPSEPFPRDQAGPARRSAVSRPLPDDAWRARLEPDATDIEAPAGEEKVLKVRVTNLGRHVWPALPDWSARYQVALGGRFRTPAGELVDTPGARGALPHDLEGGASAELFLRVPLPRRPGDYLLELDLVQEGFAWFRQKSEQGFVLLPCRLSGDPAASEPLRLLPSEPTAPHVPFRIRHPRAYALLARVPRLRELRIAAVRTVQSVVGAAQTAGFHARLLSYSARDRVRKLLDPPMAMNGIPRAQVEQLIKDAGGRLVEAEPSELTVAAWQAYRYWVVRD